MRTPPRILFPVAVDPDALLDFSDPDHKQTHLAVERLLRNHGVLSFGPGDKQALYGAVGQLVGRANLLWAGVMEYLAVVRRVDEQSRTWSLPDFLQGPAAETGSGDVVRLALIGRAAAASTAAPPTAPNTTELATPPDMDESRAVTAATKIGTFSAKTSRNEIAERLLQPLAAWSTEVKVLDPHLLEDFVNDERKSPAHVQWLVGVLAAAMPPNSTVSLVGTLQNNWSPRGRAGVEARIERLIADTLRDRTERLTVRVRLVQAAKTPLQNRYLWFSCGASFHVLHNFAPLKEEPLKQEISFVRQDDATAEQVKRIADQYESYDISAMVSITTSLP